MSNDPIEAVAQALFDRLCQRCAARGREPHHRAGTLVRDMPPSYRDDYLDDARAVLESVERFKAANCTHPFPQGTGSCSSDGSSSMEWHCPDCGKSWSHSTPPRSSLNVHEGKP